MRVRQAAARAARVATALLVVAVGLGLVPHLLIAEAAVTSAITMVLAPLSLLDSPHQRWLRIPAFLRGPFPAVTLLSIGDIAILLPPVVGALDGGGPASALVLGLLYCGAITFWAVVVAPARVTGIGAGGYVIAGSVPISMPALLLIMVPRDLYPGFHLANAGNGFSVTPLADQQIAGFVLFGMVKLVIFVAFSVIFFVAAARESRDGGDGGGDDGGSRVRRPVPGLPGWALDLAPSSPDVAEPAPRRERVLTGAGRR